MSIGAWGEGDALTPTNLNVRGGGPFSSTSMVNVSWSMFSTSRNTTSIQSAINYASTNSYAGIVIPQSYLPYDTSTISDIYTVHRQREGGPQSLDIWDVGAYGAVNGIGDAYAAFQGALNAASNSARNARSVYVPETGKYSLSQPLWIKGHHVTLRGQEGANISALGAQLYATYAYGPTVVLANSSATVPGIVASLISSTGSSFKGSATSPRWFNLRDAATCDLNGLSQLCIEMFVRFDGATTSQTILNSEGKWCAGDSASQAFGFSTRFDSKLQGFLATSNGSTGAITGGSAVASSTTYHVALTYDGSTVRLFGAAPGATSTVLVSSSLTGTVAQGASEDILLGVVSSIGLEQNISGFSVTVDSVRISDTARYTGSFTAPSSKLTNDANTLILMNFENQVGMCSEAQTKNGTAWMWCRQTGSSINPISDVAIENLIVGGAIAASGVVMVPGCQNFQMRNVLFSHYRDAVLVVAGDNYPWHFSDIYLQSGVRRGLMMLGNAVFGTLDNLLAVETGALPVILQGGTTWRTGYVLADTTTVFELLSWTNANPNSVPIIDNVAFSAEVGVGSGWRGDVAATTSGNVHASGVNLRNCTLETRTAEPLTVDSTDIVVVDSCTFSVLAGSPTGLVKVLGASTQPVEIRRCVQNATFTPWSATTGAVNINRIGPFYSASTGSTLNFDASVADEWDLMLTSDVTQSMWTKISYGQPVSGAIKMDSTGSRLFTWPTNSKGTVTLSYGSAAINTFAGFYDGVNVILTSVRTGL